MALKNSKLPKQKPYKKYLAMLTFNQIKKNLKKDFSGLKKIRIALLADSASQMLNQAIRGYGYEQGIDFDIYESDYNQIEMQIMDLSSELYEFKPEIVFINHSSAKVLKEFYKSHKSEKQHFAVHKAAQLNNLLANLKENTTAKIILNTYNEINDGVYGNYAAKSPVSFVYQLRKLNVLLMEFAQKEASVFLLDQQALQSYHGLNEFHDPKHYINADLFYSLDATALIAKHFTDIVLSISGTFKKCVIVDLDNTMWGGIIGDDGMEGIQIGDLGIGKAFTELQLWLKQLKERGIILAVCSKNTEEIAKEPFISHPEMVLREADISVFVANWETKVDNIRYIQEILNIGFDSMVFLDDNPFEREMVKSAIPGLMVPDLPEDPSEYIDYLRRLNLFETASVTEEDEVRTQQYQEEAKRAIFQKSFANEDEFLQSLEMESEVKPFGDFTIPRVAQLSQRSNQFNLRTVRYTDADIQRIAKDPSYLHFTFTLEDKFGDHGLIAVVIMKAENEKDLFIDTWIMSCRVLKRGMEHFTLSTLKEEALKRGFSRIIGEYIPTKKNGLVKDHYQKLGFEEKGGLWILDLKKENNLKSFIAKK